MFFNDDILYRNGALAIVWLAGNGMFNSKNKRSKDMQKVLKSNVIRICRDLRGLFPRMGTAQGIPLIKMGVLAKGAGQIYCLKMNSFARDVLSTLTSLNKPMISESRISIPAARQSKSKAKTVTTEGAGNQELPGPNETVFGEIPGHFEGENVEQEFGTPRALPSARDSLELSGPIPPFRMQMTPPREDAEETAPGSRRRSSRRTIALKRPREEDSAEDMYEDVIRKLRSNIADPRAHCMLEDVPITIQDPMSETGFGDAGGFGDGMDLLNLQGSDDAGMQFDDQPGQPAMEITEDRAGVPIAPTSVSVGPPSSLEMDTRSRVMETPERGTRSVNHRARRGENDDADRMVLEDITSAQNGRGRVARARRRLRLQIDAETNISLQEMLKRVNAQSSQATYDALRDEMKEALAHPKSMWKFIPKSGNAMDFIKSCGRPLRSVSLIEMKNEIMDEQLRRPERSELSTSDATLEEQRDRTGQTTRGGISLHSIHPGAQGQSITMPPMELQPIEDLQPALEQAEPPAAAPDFDQNIFQEEDGAELPRGVVTSDDDQQVLAPAFEEPEQGPAVRRPRESLVDETSRLSHLTGEQTFSKLYPPGQVSRRRAALAFITVLKMQAKKEVKLRQAEPFGEIIIEYYPSRQ